MHTRIAWERISDTLLEKYSGQAPRYTSYPTALEWKNSFVAPNYKKALTICDEKSADPLSLYFHIPFCQKRCKFCGCASDVVDDEARYDAYLDGIESELRAVKQLLQHRRRVAQVHLGGGTPTVLDSSRLRRLLAMIADGFDIEYAEEIAIEAAPSVTTTEQLNVLADLGFNRISLGVQDFTPKVQQAVDRIQSLEHTSALVELARKRGFVGVNFDLMYGLPLQSPQTWGETLEAVIHMAPDRIAVFGYAHVPWMRPHQKELEVHGLPDTTARLNLFRMAHDTLIDAGYVYIGMDHFAKPGDTLVEAQKIGQLSRNFQGYTVKNASSLIGFGATAISDLGLAFAQNQPNTESYLKQADQDGLTTYRGMSVTEDDRLRRHVITELMCNLTVDMTDVSNIFSIDFKKYFEKEQHRLETLEKDGLIQIHERRIDVTAAGRMFVRHVGLAFDVYSQKKQSKGKRFSRTV